MLRSTAFLLFILITIPSIAQEICNNGIDDDFDGFIDCYDGSCASDPLCDGLFLGNDAACEAPPASFPKFTMSLDFSSADETTNHLSRMAIGDLDRDGIPEIVTMNRYTKKLYILSGKDGSIKSQQTVTFEPYWEVAIANIDDDNCAEIYFIGFVNNVGTANDGVFLFAYDCGLNFLWQSAQKLPDDPINFGIADFDGDGQEEIYAKDEVYDAKTGTRIIKTSGPVYKRINGGPVAVNILGDEKLELVIGLNIYQVNLGDRTADAGSLTLLKGRTDYYVRNEYNATSIADYNLDGYLDVIASGSTTSNGKNTTVFYWDVQNDAIKTFNDFQPGLGSNYANGWVNGTGRINVADLDGNGQMNASFVSGRFLYALDENFSLLWRVNINEETSGNTGCTLFDFNGDGKAEIVYRDERYLYIIEGTDGSIYSQQTCISRTNREYPIVADVDADGSTELCVTCGYNDTNAAANFNNLGYSRYSHIRVFKSAAEPWVPARRVWNQHGYFVVNVNDDLTIPKQLQQHQLVFSTGNCTQGPNRPLNKFLNQAPYLNSEGCPTYASPDIAFQAEPTIITPTCPETDFKVSFSLINKGDVAISGDIPITFYSSNPLKAGAVKLNTITASVNQLEKGKIFEITDAVVTGIGSDSLYVVLNDAGTSLPSPISLPNTSFIECDYDNIRSVRINYLPVTLTALEESPDEACSNTYKGVAKAYVPLAGGGENTTDYFFYWSKGSNAKPIASADFVGAIYSGLNDSTYTVYARHKTASCGSDTVQVVITEQNSGFPDISVNVISNQTSCSPYNGEAEVVITGGTTGYDIEWFDQGLSQIGVTGAVANTLAQGEYLIKITAGECSTSTTVKLSGPAFPDVSASVLQDVLDCENLNSGSITASVSLNGNPENPDDYTFNWFQYNNVTSKQGSVLDPTHGTGPTRTGLPVGYYQVEVTNNSSKCTSFIKPVVQVKSNSIIPDVPEIVAVSNQTSCDATQGNGVLTANVTLNGVPQNPADYSFEWFKGANTLPENKVTTVSDTNGKTVNGVTGGGTPYTVRVKNSFNCSATANLAIPETLNIPEVSLSQLTPNSICDTDLAGTEFNGSLQASVTLNGVSVALPNPDYSFIWKDNNNNVIPVTDNTNPVLTNLEGGKTYSVTVKIQSTSCASAPDSEPVLNQKVLPLLETSSTGSNNCDENLTPDGTASVAISNAQAGETFKVQWYSGNDVVAGNELSNADNHADQLTAIALGGPENAPHAYTVQVINNNTGCDNKAIQFVADESVIPVISFAEIKGNSFCSPSSNYNGLVRAEIENMIGVISDYTFTWYNGNTNNPVNINPSSVNELLEKLPAASYTVEAKNTKTGCESAAITTQVPDERIFPAISIASTASNNCSDLKQADGSLTANITNGGSNFSYQWTAIASAKAVDIALNHSNDKKLIKVGGPANAPNSYQVVVKNLDTGCENIAVGLVADGSEKPTLTLDVTPNSVCALLPGGATVFNGKIEVTDVTHPFKGTSNISYKWFDVDALTDVVTGVNNNSTNENLTNLDNGKYGVQATIDDLGCSSEIEIREVLDDITPPSITTNVQADINCINPNGVAEVINPLGSLIRYQWYKGNLINPANIIAGKTNALLADTLTGGISSNYIVLVTDLASGCQNQKAINIPAAEVTPSISISVINNNRICDLINLQADGELQASVSGVGPNYSINWTGAAPGVQTGANGENYTQLKPGNYNATVTDNDTGCESNADNQTILNDLTYPNIQVTASQQTSCDPAQPNGKLIATDGGTTALRTFEWYTGIGIGTPLSVDAGDPANQIDDLNTGDYTVRVTIDNTGCSAVQTNVIVERIKLPTISFSTINAVTNCSSADGSVTPAITNASPTFTIYYVYTNEDGTPPSNSTAIVGTPSLTRNNLNPYQNLKPGYVSAVVINDSTHCTSNPFTGIIADNTAEYDIQITGTSPATNCGDPNGGIDITVTGGSGNYNYNWYTNTPTNTNINFFDNPPAFAGGVLTTTEDLGVASTPPDNTITTGTYTVVVTDVNTGCGNYFVTNVPFADTPLITITPTANVNCVSPTGSLKVEITPGPVNTTGYSIIVYAGTTADPTKVKGGEICFDGVDNDGDGFTDGADPKCGTLTLTTTGLVEGDYHIVVYDNDVINRPCPIANQFVLKRNVKSPLVNIDNVIANTSCDLSQDIDGQVQLSVSSETTDTQPKEYYISTITPLPQGYALAPAPGNIIGTGASGQNTGLIPGFSPQDYTFTIIDKISECSKNIVVRIPEQQGIPADLNVNVTPETACAPLTNGEAMASLANGDNIDRYDFTWYKDNDATANVTASTTGGASEGEIINSTKVVAADWTIGTTGYGSGNRTFYVRAVKNTNAPNGVGCATSVKQVNIPDQHIAPNLSLSSTFNSFCNAVNTGDVGDGSITITADANPLIAGTQNSVAGFNYAWTNANAILTSPQNGQSNNFTIPQLGKGTFTITATNIDNNCIVVNDAEIKAAPFNVKITDFKTKDQLICNPDGTIDVVQITIDRSATGLSNVIHQSTDPLTSLYDFEWYPADAADENIIDPAALTDVPGPTIINNQTLTQGTGIGQYNNMQAGTYYVKATRKNDGALAAGCSTAPVRIDLKDKHENPTVTLTPLSNTSCLTGTGNGEGEISVYVTDQTDPSFGVFSYDYDWTTGPIADAPGNNGNGNSSDGDNDHISNLESGVYAIKVQNTVTGCYGVANTEIFTNKTPVFIQEVEVDDQLTCDPLGDGKLTVTKITLNDRNGNEQVIDPSTTTNFEFYWSRTVSAFTQQTPEYYLDVTNYDAAGFGTFIGADTFTVVAKQLPTSTGTTGKNCPSAPFTVRMLDNRINPIGILTPFANTSCLDSSPEGEGAISVKVSDNTLVPGPHSFTYTWNSGPTSITTASPGANNGNADNSDGDEDMPEGLLHGVYSLTIINNQSQCIADASTEIYKNSTPIIIPKATATPQVLCKAEGSIKVEGVTIKDRDGNEITPPISDFNFVWYKTSLSNQVASTSGALGNVPGGTILDQSIFNDIGFGTYLVEAINVNGTIGRNCPSAPYVVDILDQRLYPEVTFESVIPNSNCTEDYGNGAITANASELNGANNDSYSFTWNLNGGAIHGATTQTNNSNSSVLTNALNGSYKVTITNNRTECPIDGFVELEKDSTRSTPNIIDVIPVLPVDCNPSASASVVKITIGSTSVPGSNEVIAPELNNYEYAWYNADQQQLPIGGPPFTTTPTNNALTSGIFYVMVKDPVTQCFSGLKEVFIDSANIIYPVLNIEQTKEQVTCISEGSAELMATADGFNDSNTNYSFEWFANGTYTTPVYSNTSTIGGLNTGTYSIVVRNSITGCSAKSKYIIEDATAKFIPQISMSIEPLTLCSEPDGVLLARVSNINPGYPYTYDQNTFTADIYAGDNPDLNLPPLISDMTAYNGMIWAFRQESLTDGTYTVRIRDNNTGCFGVATDIIKDERVYPTLDITEISPVTNCDVLRPNGVAEVSAGGLIAGFSFEWFEGTNSSGTPVYNGVTYNQLKPAPQSYVIKATNLLTGCFTEQPVSFTDGTVPAPAPTIEVLSNVTSCITNNGALTVYVGVDKNTKDYIFDWFNGTREKSPADYSGIYYENLSAGDYSVIATDIYTGCKSPLVTAPILLDQKYPDFDFTVENSSCNQNNGYATIILNNDVPVETMEWAVDGTVFLQGPNYSNAGAGEYTVTVTTFEGCFTTKPVVILAEIKPFNGISRNNDGKNDFFKIDCIDQYPQNEVKIFNRAGTLVYEATGYDNNSVMFDGVSNRGLSVMGSNLPDGTYFYIIDKKDGSKPLTGYLEIVK